MATRKALVLINGVISELPTGDNVDVVASSAPLVAKFTIVGDIAAGGITGINSRWYPEKSVTLSSVYFSLGTAPTGTAVIDVLKNGASIFPGSKPTCSSGQYKSSVVNVTVAMTPSDYLTISVVTASGSDAVVCIAYQ